MRYHLTVVKTDRCDTTQLVRFVRRHIPSADMADDVGSEITFILPQVRVAGRPIPPPWGSIRLRLALRTYAPWGCIVRVVGLTTPRKPPPEKSRPPLTPPPRVGGPRRVRVVRGGARGGAGQTGRVQLRHVREYVSRAVQFHPNGGQLEFARSPARTTHPHGAHV